MKVTKKVLELVARRQELDAGIKVMEEEKKEISGKLLDYMTAQGEDKADVEVGGKRWALSVQIRAGQEKVVREKLLELGVELDVIVAATVKEKDSAPFVTVKEVKEKVGKGEKDNG